MCENRMKSCILAAALALAGSLFSPSASSAADVQTVPHSPVSPATFERVLLSEKGVRTNDAAARTAAKPKAARSDAASNRPRQLAIIVILLSTLGVATRLLWRRHLRAVSFVQDADVDDEVRSN